DGYPAPYFDNVSLKCYQYFGPAMSARELDLAQDNFPADGQIHLGADMHLNDIRFDMANNISLPTDLRNDPGDSIVCTIVAVRTGSTLVETDVDPLVKAPRLYWILQPGPSVDPAWRTNLALAGSNGSLDADGNLFGEVQGAHAVANGVPSPDRWMFDLPDEGFLYPGDVLHYFMEAWDNVSGNYQYASLPPDRTGFSNFNDPQAYDPRFKMRALPTLKDDEGSQPDILFWNDFGNRGGRDEWHNAFGNLGLLPGEDFDFYYTNQPTSGVGNGLGGRAAYGQLDGYDILLYTCGDLDFLTITDVQYNYLHDDAGDDVGLLDDWLERGDKYLFATGDGLVSDLNWPSVTTQAFINDWMGVAWLDDDTRPLLGGDTAPMVYTVPGNSVFATTESWIAYGSCPVLNTFDALTTEGGEMLAVFNDGASGLSAATKCTAPNGSVVLTMPYDFMTIWTPSSADKIDQPAGRPRRVDVLQEVLADAGAVTGTPTGITLPDAAFTAKAFPNPFNPLTKIEFNMPQAGHLSLKIFNVRGELVRTLIDEVRPQGKDHVMWSGVTDKGRRVSSGIYFFEARTVDGVEINKMTLVQ
ncbi:MAG: hypothetical protein KOO60_12330, partial [Gemmatimonadales bacterium]|nr:hypothetical protein [Gemmatimonadales bacterium]